jgi:pilus assembly protein CpaE
MLHTRQTPNQKRRSRAAWPLSDDTELSGSRSVTFHGAKGGVGASLLAAETAMLWADHHRVVSVDADLWRGTLHYRLDLPVKRGTFTITELLSVGDELSGHALEQTLARCPAGPWHVPSGPVSRAMASSEAGAALVAALRDCFDRVVIDTAYSSDEFTSGLLSASDLVVLVVTPELAGLGGARRALDHIESIASRRPPAFVVVNRSLGTRDTVSKEDIESFLGTQVRAVLPEDTARCRRLANECRPLTSERSPLAASIIQTAQAVDEEFRGTA